MFHSVFTISFQSVARGGVLCHKSGTFSPIIRTSGSGIVNFTAGTITQSLSKFQPDAGSAATINSTATFYLALGDELGINGALTVNGTLVVAGTLTGTGSLVIGSTGTLDVGNEDKADELFNGVTGSTGAAASGTVPAYVTYTKSSGSFVLYAGAKVKREANQAARLNASLPSGFAWTETATNSGIYTLGTTP